MKEFVYSYPMKVYFGEGAARKAIAAELGRFGKTVMLAYGGGSIKKSGVYDEMRSLLTEAGKEIVDFSGIMPNPTYAKVQEGAALVREKKVDFILAVGGGSVIDCCKVISAQAVLDEDIWDMEYGKGKFPTTGIPMGAVVTASGTGAEMNAGSVITCEEKMWKGPIFGTAASFAVLDPSYTMTVPKMQVLSGAFDTLSHAMETYLGTSDQDNVSDDVALAVMRNTVVNMRRVLVDINDISGARQSDVGFCDGGEWNPESGPCDRFPGSSDRASAWSLYGLQPWTGSCGDPAGLLSSYFERRRRKIHTFCESSVWR